MPLAAFRTGPRVITTMRMVVVMRVAMVVPALVLMPTASPLRLPQVQRPDQTPGAGQERELGQVWVRVPVSLTGSRTPRVVELATQCQ